MNPTYRQPMPAFVKNGLILLSSGLIASVLCAKVYGATLPSEETSTPAVPAASAPAPAANSDAAAAAQLRAMLAGRTVLVGTSQSPAAPRQ
ncbi:MAG TPA: hypothetical protein VFB13_04160 [Reyranella sp.]|nr:hypothetical protein [Reyranella sp.]